MQTESRQQLALVIDFLHSIKIMPFFYTKLVLASAALEMQQNKIHSASI